MPIVTTLARQFNGIGLPADVCWPRNRAPVRCPVRLFSPGPAFQRSDHRRRALAAWRSSKLFVSLVKPVMSQYPAEVLVAVWSRSRQTSWPDERAEARGPVAVRHSKGSGLDRCPERIPTTAGLSAPPAARASALPTACGSLPTSCCDCHWTKSRSDESA